MFTRKKPIKFFETRPKKLKHWKASARFFKMTIVFSTIKSSKLNGKTNYSNSPLVDLKMRYNDPKMLSVLLDNKAQMNKRLL